MDKVFFTTYTKKVFVNAKPFGILWHGENILWFGHFIKWGMEKNSLKRDSILAKIFSLLVWNEVTKRDWFHLHTILKAHALFYLAYDPFWTVNNVIKFKGTTLGIEVQTWIRKLPSKSLYMYILSQIIIKYPEYLWIKNISFFSVCV